MLKKFSKFWGAMCVTVYQKQYYNKKKVWPHTYNKCLFKRNFFWLIECLVYLLYDVKNLINTQKFNK